MNFSTDQQIRFDVITRYLNGSLGYREALVILKVKERQFRRIVKKFKEEGLDSLNHGNKSRVPHNKIHESLRNKIIKLYQTRYLGLNLTHFREKLIENSELEVVPSYASLRMILIEQKIFSPQTRASKRSRPRRVRYDREGVMIQIDGSHHHWITGHLPFCLTAAIDDATGEIVAAKFTETETTFAAMDVVRSIIESKGVFQMLYSDRAGIYTSQKRIGYTNMERAMGELGILSLQASSPQAKGRVERLFRTLQDRLVSEMRLMGIKSIEEANKYLESYLPKHNEKFKVQALNPKSAYKPVQNKNLDDIFTMREWRTVACGETFSYQGNRYLLKHKSKISLEKQQIELRHYPSGEFKVFYQNEEIGWQLFELKKRAA
jgi:hypothetical protein